MYVPVSSGHTLVTVVVVVVDAVTVVVVLGEVVVVPPVPVLPLLLLVAVPLLLLAPIVVVPDPPEPPAVKPEPHAAASPTHPQITGKSKDLMKSLLSWASVRRCSHDSSGVPVPASRWVPWHAPR